MHYASLSLNPTYNKWFAKSISSFLFPLSQNVLHNQFYEQNYVFHQAQKKKLKKAEIWMLFFSLFLSSIPFYQVNKYSEIQVSKRSHHSNLPLIGKILIASGK